MGVAATDVGLRAGWMAAAMVVFGRCGLVLMSWVSWRAGRVVGCWAQRAAVTRGCSSADWLAVRLSAQEDGWLLG